MGRSTDPLKEVPTPPEEYRQKPVVVKQTPVTDKPDPELLAMLEEEGLIENSFKKEVTAEQIEEESKPRTENTVAELFNAENIELKTDLYPKEVVAAAQIMFMAERYDIGGLDHFVHNLLKLKVSQLRRGRREFVEGLHAEEKKERGPDLTPLGALLGRLGGG